MKNLLVRALFLGALLPAAAQDSQPDDIGGYWRPILDKPLNSTFWNIETGYALPADTSVKSWDSMGIFEVNARGHLWFTETDYGADYYLTGAVDTFLLHGFDGFSSTYPLMAARLQMLYSQRFQDGYGIQAEAMPGLYSTLEGMTADDLAFPFRLAAVKDVSPQFGARIGFSVYPGFDQALDPNLALRWEISDDPDPGRPAYFTAEVGYPETRVRYSPDDVYSVFGGFRIWNWPEFQMDEDDAREKIRFDETRVFAGVEIPFADTLIGVIEAGYLVNRELSFENRTAQAPVKIDDSPYLKVGVGGTW